MQTNNIKQIGYKIFEVLPVEGQDTMKVVEEIYSSEGYCIVIINGKILTRIVTNYSFSFLSLIREYIPYAQEIEGGGLRMSSKDFKEKRAVILLKLSGTIPMSPDTIVALVETNPGGMKIVLPGEYFSSGTNLDSGFDVTVQVMQYREAISKMLPRCPNMPLPEWLNLDEI